jgi:hypothetical protein
MDFESAFRQELTSITELTNKVFPLTAPENTSPPYVIYLKTRINPIQTHSSTLDIIQGLYEVNLLHSSYSQLQDLYQKVKSKLINIQQRVIGTNGPFLQECTILNVVELYENQVKLYRMNIEFKVTYKEVF